MSNSLVQQFRDQFHAKHGEYIHLEDGRILFADGAWCEESPMGASCEPSGDPLERAKLNVKFWEAKLQRAVRKFDLLREQLHESAKAAKQSGYSPPSESDLDPLRRLQQDVKEMQREVAKARKKVEDSHPNQRLKQAALIAARNVANADDVIRKISSIRV